MRAFFREIYAGLFPDENADPAVILKWRKFVGNMLFVLSIGALLAGIAVTKGLPRFGSLVWAADLKEKVEEAVKPLDTRLNLMEKAVEAQATSTKSLIARITSDQISFLVKRHCKSRDPEEREYLMRQIGNYAEEYEDARGKAPKILQCHEIEYREPR